jgi:dihydrofolate synthase/folylpolyglutamate synthase
LTIVGSKGKGTAATYASAYLSAAHRRVVTITSPSYRSNRERIRIDGHSISGSEMADLAKPITAGIKRLPRRAPGSGYLAPSGLFILAGMLYARSVAPDVIVLEAGKGGRSDEASLFPPLVTAITPIFEEHLGELGNSVAEIAHDKASIVGPATRSVLSTPQRDEVEHVLRTAVAESSQGNADLVFTAPHSSGVPTSLLPSGLSRANAELGCLTAQCLLDLTTPARPAAGDLRTALSSIALPGRLSWHQVPGTETTVLLDQAVTRPGIVTALTMARTRWGEIDHVLVSLSDDKDLDGAVAELEGPVPVTFVQLNRPHLSFTREIPSHWTTLKDDELTTDRLGQLGRRVLALGTFSFVASILALLDVDTEQLFTAPPRLT